MPNSPTTLYSNPMRLYYLIGGAIVVVVVFLFIRGLSVTPPPAPGQTGPDKTVENPWPQASKDLERETDAGTCRRVLDQVNATLAANPDLTTLPALSTAEEKGFRTLFAGFTDDDAKELRAASFTRLDAHHLAECYYIRDVAKALDVADLPPLEQAKRAFAFVCRQVYLNRWILRFDQNRVQPMPPVPPSYVLRRGWGTGLERAMVFLALLRQLGLDGCLIGPPGAEGKPGLYAPPDKSESLDALNGPFWASGVRIGKDVFLFDPWRGKPFPGPGEVGPGTLDQLKGNPKLLEEWTADKAMPWDVPASGVQAGEIYLTAPLSSMAPRMKVLEQMLTGPSTVRVFVDAVGIQDRFKSERAGTPPPKWWSPQFNVDPSDILHGMATFLPSEEGGREGGRGPAGLMPIYQNSLLPATLFVRAPELNSGEAQEILWGMMRGVYHVLYVAPPSPLERLQRGNYFDVATYLTEKERGFSQASIRYRNSQELPPPAKEFLNRLNDLYGQMQKARVARDATAEATLREEINGLWARRELAGLLIERSMAEPAEAEATYLLAMCKHEAADRAAGRADRSAAAARAAAADAKADPEKVKAIRNQAATTRATAVNAWKEALTWWQQYRTVRRVQDAAFPGRAAHTDRLADEAADRAAKY